MGERLAVSIIKDQKKLASVYFHWSRFTLSALTECQKLIRIMNDEVVMDRTRGSNNEYHDVSTRPNEYKTDDLRVKLALALYDLDGGLYPVYLEKEREVLRDHSLPVAINHTCGMIAVSKEGIRDLEDIVEIYDGNFAVIDLDKKLVKCMSWEHRSLSKKDMHLTVLPCKERLVPFDQLEGLIKFLHTHDSENEFITRKGRVARKISVW
ncbi:MAG: hypothetical protein Q4B26_06155 [Eubacteriales bacterium]|nr:hypothetical protein [Eubacteriales bacterium]